MNTRLNRVIDWMFDGNGHTSEARYDTGRDLWRGAPPHRGSRLIVHTSLQAPDELSTAWTASPGLCAWGDRRGVYFEKDAGKRRDFFLRRW